MQHDHTRILCPACCANEAEIERLARIWHSIESAPKDGREIDLLCRNWEGRLERWCRAHWDTNSFGNDNEGEWQGPWSDGFDSGLPDHRLIPTHWMMPPDDPNGDLEQTGDRKEST